MELEPQPPGEPASLADRVAQTQSIVLVGATGRIPLRLGMGHVADGSHKPVVIPTLGEAMVHTISPAVTQVRRTSFCTGLHSRRRTWPS